jgi:hypothetical protein
MPIIIGYTEEAINLERSYLKKEMIMATAFLVFSQIKKANENIKGKVSEIKEFVMKQQN